MKNDTKKGASMIYISIVVYALISLIAWSSHFWFSYIVRLNSYAGDFSHLKTMSILMVFDTFMICTFTGLFMILLLMRKITFLTYVKYQLTLMVALLINLLISFLLTMNNTNILISRVTIDSKTLMAMLATVSIIVIIYAIKHPIGKLVPALLFVFCFFIYVAYDFSVSRYGLFTNTINYTVYYFPVFVLFFIFPILYAYLIENSKPNNSLSSIVNTKG